ncbi:MAG: glycosyltransferase [Bacteroidales bacterium]|nr:glycosyltransferase [Bacteroidales bacterium]
MELFMTLSFLIVAIYAFTIISFAAGWLRLNVFEASNLAAGEYIYFSVVIAFRNELKHIVTLVSALKALDYPDDKYEVIFVNDHSNDGSPGHLAQLISSLPNFKMYSMGKEAKGKKAAIGEGVKKAVGTYCVFTDADCCVPNGWLKTLNSFCQHKSCPDMVLGLVDLKFHNRWPEKCFRLEFLSLILSSAGATALKMPFMCNGANLAIKRDIYSEADKLKTHIASGDDVFLLHDIKKRNKSIEILKSHNHLVYTENPVTFKNFFRQRVRWGSKAPFYTDAYSIFVSLMVLLANLLIIAAIVSAFHNKNITGALSIAGIKFIADLFLFLAGNRFFRIGKTLLFFPVIGVFYPIYILVVAIAILLGWNNNHKWQ